MERTTWQDIKDRVEIKVSDDIEIDAFITLANESLDDLHEVAFIEAAPIFYKGNDIKRSNDYFKVEAKEIVDNGRLLTNTELEFNGIQLGKKCFFYKLPFYYTPSSNSLSFSYDEYKNTLDIFLPNPKYKETNIIIFDLTNYDPFDLLDSTVNTNFEFRNSVMRAPNKEGFYETIIKLPENFSTIIKLEAYEAENDVFTVESTSLNSMDFNNWSRTNNFAKHLYFMQGETVHIISWNYPKEFVLYYTRRLEKLNMEVSLNNWPIEFENNFANLLTYSIAHKYNENYVGSEDTETTALFNKYMTLKNEYEQKNMPKKIKRIQTEIIVKW